jgi:NAD(P)H-dependent FMN reductase
MLHELNLLAISGSLREKSYNTASLREAIGVRALTEVERQSLYGRRFLGNDDEAGQKRIPVWM